MEEEGKRESSQKLNIYIYIYLAFFWKEGIWLHFRCRSYKKMGNIFTNHWKYHSLMVSYSGYTKCWSFSLAQADWTISTGQPAPSDTAEWVWLPQACRTEAPKGGKCRLVYSTFVECTWYWYVVCILNNKLEWKKNDIQYVYGLSPLHLLYQLISI